jgi:hypothetical protein
MKTEYAKLLNNAIKAVGDDIFASSPMLDAFRKKKEKMANPDAPPVLHHDYDQESRRAWLRERVAAAYGEAPSKTRCTAALMSSALDMREELWRAFSGKAMSQDANEWKNILADFYPEMTGTELTLDNFRLNLNRWINDHEPY